MMGLSLFRIKKWTARRARLSAALVVAGVYCITNPAQSWMRIRDAVLVWFKAVRSDEKASFWLYFRRMRACHRCPIFYRKLRTCGTPLLNDLRSVGCHCNMETKASIEEAECWLHEFDARTDNSPGWPDAACKAP